MTPPRVLIATVAAGGGHVATAAAMAEAVVHASDGEVRVQVRDVMADLAPRLDDRHKRSWRSLLARPRMVRAAQAAMDASPELSRVAQNALLAGFTRAATADLRADTPDLIVVNHGWLATSYARATATLGLEDRLVVFATEPFDASALWSAPTARTVLAPSAAAASDLIRIGVRAAAVEVAGYPVARRFSSPPTRKAARSELHLPSTPTVLVSLGAEGVASVDPVEAARELALAGATVLFVNGRNAALGERARLASPGAGAGSIRVLGHVENMEFALAASDLVVGKAGPASVLEAVAVGRPLLLSSFAGLNELAVTRFVVATGLGRFVPDMRAVPAAAAEMLGDPAALFRMASAAERFDMAAASAGIGRFLALMARTGERDPGLLAPGRFADVTKSALGTQP